MTSSSAALLDHVADAPPCSHLRCRREGVLAVAWGWDGARWRLYCADHLAALRADVPDARLDIDHPLDGDPPSPLPDAAPAPMPPTPTPVPGSASAPEPASPLSEIQCMSSSSSPASSVDAPASPAPGGASSSSGSVPAPRRGGRRATTQAELVVDPAATSDRCRILGCDAAEVHARGLCHRHYDAAQRGGKLDAVGTLVAPTKAHRGTRAPPLVVRADPESPAWSGLCRIEGCPRPRAKRGLCGGCYARAYAQGPSVVERVALPPLSPTEAGAKSRQRDRQNQPVAVKRLIPTEHRTYWGGDVVYRAEPPAPCAHVARHSGKGWVGVRRDDGGDWTSGPLDLRDYTIADGPEPPTTSDNTATPLPDDVPLLTIARAVGMVDAGDQVEMAARVVRLEGELRRFRNHLDDIRCDILDRGHPLGDDSDPELTPRRLVREILDQRDDAQDDLARFVGRLRRAMDLNDRVGEAEVVVEAEKRLTRSNRGVVLALIDVIASAGDEARAHLLAALRAEVEGG